MGLSLSELKEITAKVAVAFAGDAVNVEYRPNAFTPELEELIRGATEEEAKAKENPFLKAICAVVASWDLLDKPGGKPWPITPEKLRVVPSPLLIAVLGAIGEAQRPPEKKSGSFS